MSEIIISAAKHNLAEKRVCHIDKDRQQEIAKIYKKSKMATAGIYEI